ncbi:putative Lanthionine synthetase C-like [Vibrio nigripulchritudo SFn27]|uniref:Putative Lanthionine synthetase C-like n=1 Tax=Vibrio nigripulchritudo TaxID=28173 RepID=U4KEL9_9VIBR|nr:lanthionine synthetase C family protein [Vibrio nigripulchritudo]CCN81366.1 putative Lanthionine synthetase C-like [Vibrio nigripulchritudo BLFn1]CCN91221.1 putative Lanthionine synthetase C-like [Vibrio nigripulchritudo SFn27]CCN96320.1 putative Lanthionine synthetase C-like [Vibrio nigripulchritudo ENn2]CCO38536.1 putative Lanthionine synthetase C-like [Vibrio nigripulchritudo SFn135]CCO50435.1 putative Lanthionine synthetase C-like [Vibrio nigripulchritudo Wn13]
MVTDEVETEICDILKEISKYINHEKKTVGGNGLLTGRAGKLLFQWHYSNCEFADVDTESFHSELESIQTYFQSIRDVSLSDGLSGFAWLLEHFLENDEYDSEITEDIDAYIKQVMSGDNWTGDYEIVLGISGIAAFARRRFGQGHGEGLYTNLISRLINMSTETSVGICWETPNHSPFFIPSEGNPNFNLGLAHGVPSAIATLANALPLVEAQLPQIRYILKGSLDWLIAQKVKSNNVRSYFSYIAGQTTESRLSWSYGDASNALVIGRAAQALNDDQAFSIAESIALNASLRKKEEASVYDAGICRGSAGLYLIFYHLWELFEREELLQAANYWLNETLNMYREEGLDGFNSYFVEQDSYIADAGFLEGYAGVGLCLLHAIGVNRSWDDCLLLS